MKNIMLSNTQRSDENRLLCYETLLLNIPVIIYFQDRFLNYCCGSHCAHMFLEDGIDENAKCVVDDISFLTNTEDDNFVLSHKKQLVLEKKVLDTKGKEHWYKIIKTPVFAVGDEIGGVVTCIQNIDKAKRTENQIGMFLHTLAHDMKNIVQAQLRSLELIRNGMFGAISEAQKEMIDMTVESLKFMKSLVYSINLVFKDYNGIIKLERTSFDITEVLQNCVGEVRCLGQERNVCINLSFGSENEAIIYADKSLIRRVFENILNNVVCHAFDNTCVKVHLENKKDKFVISFENESKTISDELKKQIFDKYVSSKRNGFNIGLGLYFCKKTVLAHEGELYLENSKEKNKFVVELPLLDETRVHVNEISL